MNLDKVDISEVQARVTQNPVVDIQLRAGQGSGNRKSTAHINTLECPSICAGSI
jgi:hypothetical protein